ncbi:MAG: LON peptidase substrate-binding domain-containing protein [Leptonema sp. (in: bacteria)]
MEFFLPLFPLNTVFFPGTMLEVQIFEERYKKLFSYVLNNNSQIGIFCIKEGIEAYGPLPIPYSVGTLSKVYDYEVIPYSLGNSQTDNIIKVQLIGIKKIQLLYEYESHEHFWIGNVIPCEENYTTKDIKEEERDTFYSELFKYLQYHNYPNINEIQKDNLVLLCHFALKNLSIPLEEKQRLLEVSSFLERWTKTLVYLKQKNDIIEQIKKKYPDGSINELN